MRACRRPTRSQPIARHAAERHPCAAWTTGKLAGGVQHAKFMIVDGREGCRQPEPRLARAHADPRARRAHARLAARRGRDRGVRDRLERRADTTRAFAPAPKSPATRWPIAVKAAGRRRAGVVRREPPPRPIRGHPVGPRPDLERIHTARSARSAMQIAAQYGVKSHGATDSTIHRALIAAGERGVSVKLIVSDWAIGGSERAGAASYPRTRTSSCASRACRRGHEVRLVRARRALPSSWSSTTSGCGSARRLGSRARMTRATSGSPCGTVRSRRRRLAFQNSPGRRRCDRADA